MRLLWGIALILLATAALANPPKTSLRPQARPDALAAAASVVSSGSAGAASAESALGRRGLGRSLRPMARPARLMTSRRTLQAGRQSAAVPEPESPRLTRREARRQKRLLKKGAVCGSTDIQGVKAGDIPGKLVGCGVADAVRVKSVSGVTLSQQALMDCNTAKTLNHWVKNGLKPAVRRKGGGVSQIKVAAHYACRTRNNKRGAKISEHGKGRAIDISGFTLKNGTKITVLNDYHSLRYGKAMRKMRKAACGPFGTVLGPGSDRHHKDHFHFDTARYRSGAYCK